MNSDSSGVDTLIQGGMVVDGTGADARSADVAIRGDRIVAVAAPGSLDATAAETVVDANGRVVAPGFIDVHTHDDRAALVTPDMTPKVCQGVTSVVVGNCGVSLSPLRLDGPPPPPLNLLGERDDFRFDTVADYVGAVGEAGPAANLAVLIGHSTLRIGTMADTGRKADAREIDRMRTLLAEGLAAGAVGFSTGLFYRPNAAADMDEVVALAEVVADAGGIYTTHMRDEHDGVLESLAETFETGRRARVPILISHHKCAGPRNWGRSRETLPAIETAGRQQRVALDAYPYAAGSTVLDPDQVDDAIRILVTWSKAVPEAAGRNLADIAEEWGCSQRGAAERLDPAGAIYFSMEEGDVRRILAFPRTMIGSDGLPHDEHPHPRLWGTFPRVIGHYGRDEGLFPVEQAVHKMTGLPAETFGLTDRGVVRTGAYADLVVFDPETILDRATFEDPRRPPAGIERVFVNGTPVWQDGAATGARGGRVLKRSG